MDYNVYITVGAETQVIFIANGTNGTNGATGLNGADGKRWRYYTQR
jgi:hypothetical protein